MTAYGLDIRHEDTLDKVAHTETNSLQDRTLTDTQYTTRLSQGQYSNNPTRKERLQRPIAA